MPKRSFSDEIGEKLGYEEDVTSDEVVRWDGKRLFVTEVVHRGGVRTDTRKRDITAEVVAVLRRGK